MDAKSALRFEPEIAQAAARCLRIPRQRIDRDAPLVRFGLDSLNAVELTLALSRLAGRELPADLLLDCPSVSAIARFLSDGEDALGRGAAAWTHDCLLPEDIQPPASPQAREGALLITGASGFLGAHLVARLLAETTGPVVCLVRARNQDEARRRMSAALLRFRVHADAADPRIRLVCGDVARPRLGMTRERYAALCRDVRWVFHCAARVDWDKPYEALKEVNVGGTLEMLRFACRGARKSFHFVSSVSACYSTAAPREVDETSDPQDPEGIHLGYARSKWAAEALVRAAARRGLHARIYRPALVAGHSLTGIGNDDDLLASLFKGCIAMGEAPELDWEIDACPVDFVAAAIARLAGAPAHVLPVAHLANPRPRRWLEAVLWANLRGYEVRPVPFERWIERVRGESADPRHPLHRLRGFLLRRVEAEGGIPLPRLFEAERLAEVRSDATAAELARRDVRCPPLGAGLLERWFDAYVASGALPPPSRRRSRKPVRSPALRPALERALQAQLGDASLRVAAARPFEAGAGNGILGELASWRAGAARSCNAYALELLSRRARAPRRLRVFLKPKFEDDVVLSVASKVAELCGERLGRAFAAHCKRTALSGGARREVALYRCPDPRLRAHAPAAYGVIEEPCGATLVLEHISDAVLIGSADTPAAWTRARIELALAGIAQVHAIWYGQEQRLRALPWLGPVVDAQGAAAAFELWRALSEHARPWFARWAGEDAAVAQVELADDAPARALELERLPRALIHHDFNPRNIALRGGPGRTRLCAYDWELATLGVPQRDLAELLCFVLPADARVEALLHFSEFHRRALERAIGSWIDPERWFRGLQLALADLAADRWPMYLLVHRFQPQRFLERVVRVWWRLYCLAERAASGGGLAHAA